MRRTFSVSILLSCALLASALAAGPAYAVTRTDTSLPAVVAGTDFALCIDTDNVVWAWGNNDNAQLTSAVDGSFTAQAVPIARRAKAIAAGAKHSLIVGQSGRLYTVGNNGYGQLGHDKEAFASDLTQVLGTVADVAAGAYHSLALDITGALYSWGRNNNGQLGDGTTADRFEPKRIMNDVVKIAAGGNVSMALKRNGDLYIWGQNSMHQIGDATKTTRKTPHKVLSNIASFDTSGFHSVAATTRNVLYTWGYSSVGALADGFDEQSYNMPQRIESNTYNTALKLSSTKMTWIYGVSAANDGTLFLTSDGNVYAAGAYKYDTATNESIRNVYHPYPVIVASDMASISRGDNFFVMVGKNGKIYTLGRNEVGQLGNRLTDGAPSNTATQVKWINDTKGAQADGTYERLPENLPLLP